MVFPGLGKRRRKTVNDTRYDSAAAYQHMLDGHLARHRDNRDLAFAKAVGSVSLQTFAEQGNISVTVLRHHGLSDGMAIFDLGCGCGRTAQALQRSGWTGRYTGTDIIADFITEMKRKCPQYAAYVHPHPTLLADDESIDMVYQWSVFTHLSPEECFLYLQDSFRALKPGGKTVFSFVELRDPNHLALFNDRARALARRRPHNVLDTFLHRDWLRIWAQQIGFDAPVFTDSDDGSQHPPFWQSVAAMTKPAATAMAE